MATSLAEDKKRLHGIFCAFYEGIEAAFLAFERAAADAGHAVGEQEFNAIEPPLLEIERRSDLLYGLMFPQDGEDGCADADAYMLALFRAIERYGQSCRFIAIKSR
jgi:hypothetical protein